MLKILQTRFQQYANHEILDVQAETRCHDLSFLNVEF